MLWPGSVTHPQQGHHGPAPHNACGQHPRTDQLEPKCPGERLAGGTNAAGSGRHRSNFLQHKHDNQKMVSWAKSTLLCKCRPLAPLLFGVFTKGWPRLMPQQKDPRHFYPLCFLSAANFWHMAMLRPSPQAMQLFWRARRLWSRGSCTNQPPVVCRLCLLSAGSRGGPSGVSPSGRTQEPAARLCLHPLQDTGALF